MQPQRRKKIFNAQQKSFFTPQQGSILEISYIVRYELVYQPE